MHETRAGSTRSTKGAIAAATPAGLVLAHAREHHISLNEHGEELAKATLKHGLRAPVDGTVQQLAVHTLGGVVTPAQQLMVVVPEGTGMEIEATLPNKDAIGQPGFVHRGQEV